jgi:CMP-N-acetylneuraminic acid synthetase
MKINKKIICIIPARSGSKGLKNKNILNLSGKPLIAHTIQYALSNKKIDKVIVTTDSKIIAKISNRYGAETPFLRPKNIAGDLSTTEETLKHALLKYEKLNKTLYDYCIYLSPCDIFRNPEWIDEGIKKMIKNPLLDSVFVGYETHKNYWELSNGKWKRIKNWMKNYSSRQVREKIFREDTGLFSISKANLWRKGKRIGNNVDLIFNHNDLSSVDIHEKKDLRLANLIIDKKIDKTK